MSNTNKSSPFALKNFCLMGFVILIFCLPSILNLIDEPFYVTLLTRILIYGIIVTSLNLIIGYGGMVSLGHAAFVGTGAYTVGILSAEASRQIGIFPGTESAWIAWSCAVFVGATLSVIIGSISLRTKGVYFIMITLAFAQMLYFISVSLKIYGGDDGLNLANRSSLSPFVDISIKENFYYVVAILFFVTQYIVYKVVNSYFGRSIQGIKDNEVRMEALGYNTYKFKLICFSISGALAGLGGALLANQNSFVSPSLLSWFQSGSYLMMAIIGGLGYLWGGLAGALVYLGLEEMLSSHTKNWQFLLGISIILIVLYAPKGVVGSLSKRLNL